LNKKSLPVVPAHPKDHPSSKMEKGVRLVVCEAEPLEEVAVREKEEEPNDGTSTGGAASIVVAVEERLGDDSDLDDELESIFHHHCKGDPHSSSANRERSEIHTLPEEIIVKVLQRVTEATAVCRAAQTCRALRVLCALQGSLWRRLFQVRWGDAEECRPCEHPLCFRSNADHDSRTHWKETYIKWHAVDQNWKTGSCSVNSLEGHMGSVCACAFTGENTLVTVGEDSSIKWWDLQVMRCNFSLDKAHLVYYPYPYLYLHSFLRSNY